MERQITFKTTANWSELFGSYNATKYIQQCVHFIDSHAVGFICHYVVNKDLFKLKLITNNPGSVQTKYNMLYILLSWPVSRWVYKHCRWQAKLITLTAVSVLAVLQNIGRVEDFDNIS